ncbi:unnamed protein product [Adineta steineri]|uniref:LicD/FKTN/FKRP nucleotidyltransferase domain-containing protein n=1 Tax=Adineta steineri TaxID=433720 RepID=A0A816DKC9_9BILA|nr:unnamed protein product [Adineta steineri]CAF1637143.1 unnamed protein product [Adineta steineri]
MVVYYPENNINYTYFTQTTNYSIENALEHIPICHSYDRSRQRCLLTTLHARTDFAHEHKIHYWIAYGTLIGYLQRGGLLPHDHDIDILILAQDTQYLVPFSNSSFSSAYELKLYPQWSTVGYANRSYFRSEGIHFVAPNARFIDREFHYHVDIWPTYDFHPDQPTNITYLKKTLTDYDRSYSWVSSSIEWTFLLKPCIFSGVKAWCPAIPKRLVSMVYGIEANNETNKKCVNETWINV